MPSTVQTKQTALLEQHARPSIGTLTNEKLSLSELMQLPGLPTRDRRLYAFQLTPVSSTRVIILGQDPYPSPGKANGLAFGIAEEWEGNRAHSSFKNITMEVFRLDSVEDINRMWSFNKWATLESWARQGVLLTNTRLSVAEGQPMSHAGLGWEELVEQTLALTIAERNPILVAFGAEARKFYEKVLKVYRVPADTVTMLCYSHPCKYSATRGSKYAKAFVGSNCFNEINKALLARNQEPINWWKV